MKIIIDIEESTYINIKYIKDRLTERDAENLINAIKNAKPYLLDLHIEKLLENEEEE